MITTTRTVGLITALAAIGGLIWYLEAHKSRPMVTSGSSDIPVATSTLAVSTSTQSTASSTTAMTESALKRIAAKSIQYQRAKELVSPAGFINTGTTTIESLIGKKVILLDFWTYSCINCLRTLPYITSWYTKYKDAGLAIIGVHTPEFAFEKEYGNVLMATKMYGILYPVVLDNGYGTWSAYANQYWPREYLVDIDGFIVHDKIGEGDYGGTEAAIQKALAERSQVLGLPLATSTDFVSPKGAETASRGMTPETYFGASRNEYFANGTQGRAGDQTLHADADTALTRGFALDGIWHFDSESALTLTPKAKIFYTVTARKVFMVANSQYPNKIHIYLDGQQVTDKAVRGADVSADGTVTIKDNRLYRLIEDTTPGPHLLEIDIDDSGFQAYTFTFG